MKKWYIALSTVLLVACASGPAPIQYYVLNSPTSQPSATTAPCRVPYSIVIERIELASFLSQSALVYQTGINEITVAKAHVWAENLDQALPKMLVKYMRGLAGNCNFYIKGHDWFPDADYSVRLRVDQMHPTAAGVVIMSGNMQIIEFGSKEPALTSEFSFTRELSESGYSHAVAQMNLLVPELAETVLKALPVNPTSD